MKQKRRSSDLMAIAVAAALGAVTAQESFAQPNLLAGADVTEARAVIDRFLALNSAEQLTGPEAQALLAAELDDFAHATFGPLSAPDRLVALAGGSVVARLPAAGERPDIYLYLRRHEGSWRITGLRALALVGPLHYMRTALRAQESRTAEEEAMLGNMELTLSSDAQLRAWFSANGDAMEQLKAIAASGAGSVAADGGRRVDTPEAEALVRALHLNMVGVSARGVTRVSIGGMLDNEVGFLHSADPAAVPPIDPSDHFWVEPLGDGWYLFKTT